MFLLVQQTPIAKGIARSSQKELVLMSLDNVLGKSIIIGKWLLTALCKIDTFNVRIISCSSNTVAHQSLLSHLVKTSSRRSSVSW